MKSKIIILAFASMVMAISFMSCSEDDLDLKILNEEVLDNKLNHETLDFKKSFINELSSEKTKASNDNFKLSEDQIVKLNKKCLAMFKSHGFKENEFTDFIGEGDTRLILFAVLFTGIIEGEPVIGSPKIKTRSEGGEDTCWDVAQVVACTTRAVVSAVGADVIQGWFSGYTCLTKALVKDILKVSLSKFPWIALAVALDTLADCMGWYPWQN